MSEHEIAVAFVICPRCGAEPGNECVTKSGTRSTRAHSARTNGVRASWRTGFGQGLETAFNDVERRTQRIPHEIGSGESWVRRTLVSGAIERGRAAWQVGDVE